jgi:hypothetical protein
MCRPVCADLQLARRNWVGTPDNMQFECRKLPLCADLPKAKAFAGRQILGMENKTMSLSMYVPCGDDIKARSPVICVYVQVVVCIRV